MSVASLHQYCVLEKKRVEPYGTFLCCLQLRNPKEVSAEEYNEFYKKTFNEYLDPLASSHFTTEVCLRICIGCLLFLCFGDSMVITAMTGLDLTVYMAQMICTLQIWSRTCFLSLSWACLVEPLLILENRFTKSS